MARDGIDNGRGSDARRVFHSVTSMRGFWALVITWYHIGLWDNMLPVGPWQLTAGFAWLGPHQFFIISGFVMTWSLWAINYRWSLFPRYLLRRIVRLDPPYFVTILFVVLVSAVGARVVPGMVHGQYVLEWDRVLTHAAYATAVFDQKWYNPVFWTLGIEFQFYLLLGAIYPFVASRRGPVRWVTLALLFLLYLPLMGATQTRWMTGYLPLFMIGFLIFQYHARIIGSREFWLLAVPLLLVTMTYTPVLVGFCVVTVGLLLEDRIRNRVTEFLGRISYSLYLIHMPIGIPLVRIGKHFADTETERLLVALSVMPVCIAAAWVFYYLVERPSHRWARSIRRPAARRSGAATAQEAAGSPVAGIH